MATTSGKRKRDIVPADAVEYSLTPKRLDFEDSDSEAPSSGSHHHVDIDDDDVVGDVDNYVLACPTTGPGNNFCSGTSSGGSRRSLFGGSSPVNARDGDDEDSENHPPTILKGDSLVRRPLPKLLFATPNDKEASISFSPVKPSATEVHTPLASKPRITSPPTNGVRAMRIFDQHQHRIITSPVTAPRVTSDLVGHPHLRSRLFDTSRRRVSEPAHTDPVASPVTADPELAAAAWTSLASSPLHRPHTVSRVRNREPQRSVRKSRLANVNPFTPNSILRTAVRKRTVSHQSEDTKKPVVNTGTFTPTWHGSFSHEDLQKSLDHLVNDSFETSSSVASTSASVVVDVVVPTEPLDADGNPAKRLRVSDINISRYEEEFLELQEIASGVFGKVKVARHRLDGMIYAIKVTRQPILGRNQERAAMNEVFAHAALMKHKHIVQYYNSWVENGRIYIQNEYCEGGSLANAIKRKRAEGRTFSENELKRILLHLAKGLMYIHSKQLVHLDIKPENIFISLDHVPSSPPGVAGDGLCDGTTATSSDLSFGPSSASSTPITCKTAGIKRTLLASEAASNSCPETSTKSSKLSNPSVTAVEVVTNGNDSTDSGNASGHEGRSLCLSTCPASGEQESVLLTGAAGESLERISYKIGDLGHVAPIYGDYIPEEGDCRYMAPELLLHEVDKERLPKADIFSLGLTLYECATLTDLPKNSMEDPIYERLKAGDLPYMPSYSKEFNQLIKTMVSPDMLARPSASRLVSHPYLKQHFSKTRSNLELYKELKSTRQRLKELEMQLSKANFVKRAVGKGTKKSASSYQ